MKIVIYVCGILSFVGALYHIKFWKMFDWKSDLQSLKPVNRAVIQVLNLRLIYIFLLTACICFLFPIELISTNLGKVFLGGWSIFWLGRTIEQFIFFKSKSVKMHALTLVFVLLSILFIIPVLFKNSPIIR